jgi:hypothetical protein
VARGFFIQKLSSKQLSSLLSISQAAVTLRINRILEKVRLSLLCPAHDPIQVRTDLRGLLKDESSVEIMYHFFWAGSIRRVCALTGVQAVEAGHLFKSAMTTLRAISRDETDPNQQCLAGDYLRYLEKVRADEKLLSPLCKKFDKQRSSLVRGERLQPYIIETGE